MATKKCRHCRKEFELEDIRDFYDGIEKSYPGEGTSYCPDCIREMFTRCTRCKRLIRIRDTIALDTACFPGMKLIPKVCPHCINEMYQHPEEGYMFECWDKRGRGKFYPIDKVTFCFWTPGKSYEGGLKKTRYMYSTLRTRHKRNSEKRFALRDLDVDLKGFAKRYVDHYKHVVTHHKCKTFEEVLLREKEWHEKERQETERESASA